MWSAPLRHNHGQEQEIRNDGPDGCFRGRPRKHDCGADAAAGKSLPSLPGAAGRIGIRETALRPALTTQRASHFPSTYLAVPRATDVREPVDERCDVY